MSQPDFPNYSAVPPNVRVCWLEEYTGLSIAPVRRLRTWTGVVHNGEYYWCDDDGHASVSERHARSRGTVREGTLLGFAAGTLLVAGDDGRILTLPHDQVRRLP